MINLKVKELNQIRAVFRESEERKVRVIMELLLIAWTPHLDHVNNVSGDCFL